MVNFAGQIAELEAQTPLKPPTNVRDHHHEYSAHNARRKPPGVGVVELLPGGAAEKGQSIWGPVAIQPVFRLCVMSLVLGAERASCHFHEKSIPELDRCSCCKGR